MKELVNFVLEVSCTGDLEKPYLGETDTLNPKTAVFPKHFLFEKTKNSCDEWLISGEIGFKKNIDNFEESQTASVLGIIPIFLDFFKGVALLHNFLDERLFVSLIYKDFA